jgi:hypothetical protein
MRAEDHGPYAAASALAFAGTLVGYYVPVVGAVLTVCFLLVLLVALMGDEGGAMVELPARPFAALGRWLAQRDSYRLVRLAPVIGLVSGWLMRWIVNGLAATGGA